MVGKNAYHRKIELFNWDSGDWDDLCRQRAEKYLRKYGPDPYNREQERWFEEDVLSPGDEVIAIGRLKQGELNNEKFFELEPLDKKEDNFDKIIITRTK